MYAENAAPSTSQPFGVSGFTFGGTKYARLVLATYESLMNSELPLQGPSLDELLSSLATTLTSVTTTSFVAALPAAASSGGRWRGRLRRLCVSTSARLTSARGCAPAFRFAHE